MTDRRTDRQTEFSSLDRVCIACSAVKTKFDAMFELEKRKQAAIEAQYELEKEKQKYERAQKESIVSLAEQYGDAMKASVKPMGPEMLDVVLFFRHIEAIFRRFDVPKNLQAALIQP